MNIFGSTGVRRRTSCHRRGRRGVRRWQAGVFGGALGKVEFPASPARSVLFFTSREHVIALEPRGKGLLGVTLRYPYEVRKEDEYFADIEDEKIPKDMMELASHIVETKSGHFKPEEFEDHYEDALKELLKKKQSGEKIEAPRAREPAKVISLMDALRRSVDAERGGGGRGQSERRPAQRRTPKKAG